MAHPPSSFDRDVAQTLARCPHVLTREIGSASYGERRYPLLVATYPHVPQKKCQTVLLAGGIHGNEPAGVYAIVSFLKDAVEHYRNHCNIIAFPCMNPSGFEDATRLTASGNNINRLFGTNASQQEVRVIEDWLTTFEAHVRLVLDLHEDPSDAAVLHMPNAPIPEQCYLYENIADMRKGIGRALIDLLPTEDVCHWTEIYRERNDDGVIASHGNLAEHHTKSFDAFLLSRWTKHAITTETPTLWPLRKRIETHVQWICGALDLIKQT